MFFSTMDFMVVNGNIDFSKFSFAHMVELAAKEGFKHMELTLDVTHVIPGSMTQEKIEELKEIKKKLNLTYSVHAPLWAVEPACPNEYIRTASAKTLLESIEMTLPLDPEVFVVHGTGALASEFMRFKLPIAHKELIAIQFMSQAERTLEEILEKTDVDSKKIALETVEFPWSVTKEVINKLDLSICLDTGHLYAFPPYQLKSGKSPDVIEFLRNNFTRLVSIHLHDGGRFSEGSPTLTPRDHLALGKGHLPYPQMLEYLQEKKFKGPIVFEISLQDSLESLEQIRIKCPGIVIN